jgi:hypothetical protein
MERICESEKGGWKPQTHPPNHITLPPPGPSNEPTKYATNSPADTGGDTNIDNHHHVPPPGRPMRRFFGIGALTLIAIYVAWLLWSYRVQVRQHAHNPFRMLSTNAAGSEDEMNSARSGGGGIFSGRSNNNNNNNTISVVSPANDHHEDTGVLDMDEGNTVHEAASS